MLHRCCLALVLVTLLPFASGGQSPLPSASGLHSSASRSRPVREIGRGARVQLVGDVTEWTGSLKHDEVGHVNAVADSDAPGFKRFLVLRPGGEQVWHEQDEVMFSTRERAPELAEPKPRWSMSELVDPKQRTCELETFYPTQVTASSGVAVAVKLAGTAPTAEMQDCASATPFASSWLPQRSGGDRVWLDAELGQRLHIKDLTVYKRGPSGLISRVEGREPRHDGHKMRTIFEGVDGTACGPLLMRMPSLTPWSVDRLHFTFGPSEAWGASTSNMARETGGIASIEILGLVDSCYPEYVGESADATKLRRRMEQGFTGCSFSGVSLGEADRRAGTEGLAPGEGDTGSCGDI